MICEVDWILNHLVHQDTGEKFQDCATLRLISHLNLHIHRNVIRRFYQFCIESYMAAAKELGARPFSVRKKRSCALRIDHLRHTHPSSCRTRWPLNHQVHSKSGIRSRISTIYNISVTSCTTSRGTLSFPQKKIFND